MKKVTSILTTMLLLCSTAYSQDESLTDSGVEQKSKEIEIYFDLGSYAVDTTYQENGVALDYLTTVISDLQRDSLVTIKEIKINSYASPDGDRISNDKLTQRRTNALRNYLTSELSLPSELIDANSIGVDWGNLSRLIQDSQTPHKEEALAIIENTPEETWRRVNPTDRWQTLVDSRNKHLMDLMAGVPYKYMRANIFPQLRRGSIVTIYFKVTIPPIVETPIEIVEVEDMEKETTETTETTEIIETTAEVVEPIVSAPVELAEEVEVEKKPLLALKTNLLYDLLLTPNIEFEIPIGNRWSVAGEWIFPWWVTKDNGYALQILSGQIEGKYWFGDRTDKPQLTGWFAGFYAGGGLYDLQWKNNGYQGEFYIAAGLSGGYAHTINKSGSLRMEYSLGLGYLNTEYRYYEGMQNNEYLVWQHDGRYTWIGPTKAKVSLVWMLNKKGGKR